MSLRSRACPSEQAERRSQSAPVPWKACCCATHSSLASRVPVIFHANHFCSEDDFASGDACLQVKESAASKETLAAVLRSHNSPVGWPRPGI